MRLVYIQISPGHIWTTFYVYFFLYMFRATMCPSSGEITVCDTWYLPLCGLVCRIPGYQGTRQSSTQSDKYQVSHKYSCFSWWWTHGCPKHVLKRNKHIKKNCAPSWFYLQGDTTCQNLNFHSGFVEDSGLPRVSKTLLSLGKVIQKNQLDATMIYWSIRSAQHVSGTLLPIIRSVRLRFLEHMV